KRTFVGALSMSAKCHKRTYGRGTNILYGLAVRLCTKPPLSEAAAVDADGLSSRFYQSTCTRIPNPLMVAPSKPLFPISDHDVRKDSLRLVRKTRAALSWTGFTRLH